MLSLKIPWILVDRDRHLQSQPSSEGAYTKEPWNNSSKGRMNVASQFNDYSEFYLGGGGCYAALMRPNKVETRLQLQKTG